jgi:hypothetical protein
MLELKTDGTACLGSVTVYTGESGAVVRPFEVQS